MAEVNLKLVPIEYQNILKSEICLALLKGWKVLKSAPHPSAFAQQPRVNINALLITLTP